MKKKLILLFTMISLLTFANPRKETIKIYESKTVTKIIVIDKETNENIAGASIFIDGKKYYSDLDGVLTIEQGNINKTVSIEFISYQQKEFKLSENKTSIVYLERL